jgi:hypothetical protein
MYENAYQLFQHELEVHEVMRVHHEEGVFPSIYPFSEFMNAAGILQDFQTLISNAGLEHFIDGEPHQYAKLTMWCRILDSVGPHLTLWFIIKFTINLWICLLMFSVQLLEYHSGDHAKR